MKVSQVISLIEGCFIFSRKASEMQHEHLHGKGERRFLFPEYSEPSSGLHLPDWVYLNATWSSCSVYIALLLLRRLWFLNRYSHCKSTAFEDKTTGCTGKWRSGLNTHTQRSIPSPSCASAAISTTTSFFSSIPTKFRSQSQKKAKFFLSSK